MTSSVLPAPSPAPPVRARRPRTLRVEVRTLDPAATVISTPDGTHHVIGLPTDQLLRLLDHWQTATVSEHVPALLSPALVAAAEPVLALLVAHGAAVGGPDRPPAAPPATTVPTVLEAVGDEPGSGRGQLLVTGDVSVSTALADRSVVHQAQGRTGQQRPAATAVRFDLRACVNRAFRTGELLVVGVHGPRDADLIDLDRVCHDMRVPWVPLQIIRSTIWLGPRVTPGRGASYEDTVARLAAAAYNRRVHRALRTPSVTGDCGEKPAELADLLDAALDLLRDDEAGDVLHEISRGPDGQIRHRRHPVLPMPGSATTHQPHTPADLVDDMTGLVLRTRQIRHDASVPAALTTRQCDVADIRAVSRWANNVLCQGSTFNDVRGADLAALGESVERYCGNILDTLPVTHASFDELTRRGTPALDPAELVLYSDAQYAARGFPFVPLTRDTRVHWVPGRSLSRDTELLVPASMVYVNWYAAGFAGAPPTNFCAFAGIAAGPNADFAVTNGLEEIIERHATMVWWLNAHPLAGVQLPDEIRAVWQGTTPQRQRYSLINLDNEFGVPVAAGVVHDDSAAIVNVGFSVRPTLAGAATKAWTEALTLQEGSRDLLKMDGLHWDVMTRGELNGRAFKPWRADRAYLDDFRGDMHDCDDLMVQQQVYLDPRAGKRMAHLLEPLTSRTLVDIPSLPSRTSDVYRAALEARGHEVIVVDLTTPDVASTSLSVVRVLVPGTVGNAPAAFPFLGRRRVQDLAVELGWREQAHDEADLNYFPLPHA